MMEPGIYRKTRKPWPGTYYRPMTEKQKDATLKRWRRMLKKGSICGADMCQLMAAKNHPSWGFWRCYVRIRSEDGLREAASVVVLPPTIKFRRVKNKPRAVGG